MASRILPIVTGLLLVLLGALRGFGGVILLTPFRRHIDTTAGDGSLVLLGLGLVVVAALCVWSGTALLRRRRSGIPIGFLALVAFVLGGIVNGAVLYGAPRAAGLGGNFLAALLIAALLLVIRSRMPRAGAPSD